MKFSKGEIFFLVSVLISIFAASAMLYADFRRRLAITNLTPIGILRLKYKAVQRKYDREVVWEEIENNVPIYNRDSIRTAAASQAIIELSDGTQIQVSENSMIILNLSEEKLDIGFLYGSLRAGQQAGGSSISIQTQSGTLNLASGSEVSVATTSPQEPLAVKVTAGQASLNYGGEAVIVAQNESAVVSTEKVKVEKSPIQLINPEEGARRFITGKVATELFSWESEARDTVLEIAKDPSFERIVIRRRATQSSREQLTEGLYYWRVRLPGSKPSEFIYSEVRRLGIYTSSSIVAITPINNAIIESSLEKTWVHFQFSRNELATSYRLRVSQKPDLSEPIIDEQLMVNSFSRQLAPGDYFWQVTANVPEGVPPVETLVQKFSIRKVQELVMPPSLRSPRLGQVLNSQMLVSVGFNFNWDYQPTFKEYRLVIAQDRNFTVELVSEKTTNHFFQLRRDWQAGTYFWKVIGIDASGKEYSSEVGNFVVEESAAITLLNPVEGASFLDDSPLVFSWKTVGYQGTLQLVIARDREFQNIYLKSTIDSGKHSIAPPAAGRYFWRITARQGENMLTSEIRSFTVVAKVYQQLKLLSPVPNAIIDMSNRNSLTFRWEKVENAEYSLTILQQTPTGNVPIFQGVVSTNEYEFTDLRKLDVGKFVWIVQIVGDKPDNASSASFTIQLKETPQAPEIEAPDVIFIE